MNITKHNSAILLFVILFSILTFSSCNKQDNKEEKKASILTAQTVFGDVTVENEGVISNPVPGTEIKENSVIKTGKLSIIDLRYKDTGVIRLNENSILNVAKLMESERSDETVLEMDKGKVFVSVAKLLKKSKFEVKTATTVAAVRGTSFRVSAEPGKSRIDVLVGKIKVNPVKNNKVIETVEQYVETNNAVEVEEEAVDEIIEEKKEIEIVKLEPEDIDTIKEEVKLIKMDEAMAEETRQEMKQIGIEVKPAEEAEDDEEQYQEELTIQMQKLEEERQARKEKEELEAREAEEKDKELMLKKEAEEKQKQEQLKKIQQRKEKEKARKERLREEKERKEQLKLEKLAKEKAEKERLAKEALEKKRKEEKKKEEERVKNIPNF